MTVLTLTVAPPPRPWWALWRTRPVAHHVAQTTLDRPIHGHLSLGSDDGAFVVLDDFGPLLTWRNTGDLVQLGHNWTVMAQSRDESDVCGEDSHALDDAAWLTGRLALLAMLSVVWAVLVGYLVFWTIWGTWNERLSVAVGVLVWFAVYQYRKDRSRDEEAVDAE